MIRLSARKATATAHMTFHALAAAILLTGTIEASHWIYGMIIWYIAAVVGFAVGYHRYFSHRSFQTSPFWEWVFLLLGVIVHSGPALPWCAIHRYHHTVSDTENDPTSPTYVNWWKIYTHQWRTKHIPKRVYVPLTRHTALRKMSDIHTYYGLVIALNLSLAMISMIYDQWGVWFSITILPSVMAFHAMGIINLFGHLTGYRNFNTRDDSRNVWWLNFIIPGEGWHNNHHHDPRNPSFKYRWWEIDPASWVIRMIRK